MPIRKEDEERTRPEEKTGNPSLQGQRRSIGNFSVSILKGCSGVSSGGAWVPGMGVRLVQLSRELSGREILCVRNFSRG